MLLWGSGTDNKNLGHLPAFECRTCKNNAPHALIHSYSWGHLWYLGLISNKSYYSVCEACQTTDKLDSAKIEQITKPSYPFNHQYGWAIWVFIILAFVTFGMISDRNKSEATSTYLHTPVVGDVYAVDISELSPSAGQFHYALLKIKSTQADSIEFQASNLAYETRSGVTKALNGNSRRTPEYSDELIVVPKTKIQEMSDKGLIIEIQR